MFGPRERRFASIPAATLLILALAQSAPARQTVAPQPLFRGDVELETPWLALLREANTRGSEEQLLAVVREFLADLSAAAVVSSLGTGTGAECCDPGRHVIQVAFLASAAADAPLVRIFVHEEGLTRRLPGIRGPGRPLFEIFAAEDPGVRLHSIYGSEPLEGPLAEQTGDFVKLVLGKMALPVAADTIASRITSAMRAQPRGLEQAGMRRTRPPLAITLSRVELPSKRASVTISHTLAVTDPAGHIEAQARWIADTVLRRAIVSAALQADPFAGTTGAGAPDVAAPAGQAACSGIARAIAAATRDALGTTACSPLPAEPGACFKAVEQAMGSSYEAAVRERDACPAGDAFPLARQFLSIVPARLTTRKGRVVLTNAPRARWSFGLSTAYITALDIDDARPRAKISSGRIVVDPFSRLLAMGTVSFVPAGYDPDAIAMSLAERFRLFGGVAFAPHFGAAGGVAWSLNRYLGVNAGYALLAYDTPRSGELFDGPPSDANRADPFDLASTHALFIGLTYNIR